jgi:hypothetical protein
MLLRNFSPYNVDCKCYGKPKKDKSIQLLTDPTDDTHRQSYEILLANRNARFPVCTAVFDNRHSSSIVHITPDGSLYTPFFISRHTTGQTQI